ncbi:MAG: hypothetical protein ACR2FM_01155 [Candidatus Saccharimonadales bacterium]
MSGTPENKNSDPFKPVNFLRPVVVVGAIAVLGAANPHLFSQNDPLNFDADAEARQQPEKVNLEVSEAEKHCTSLRRKPNDIYIGFGCVEDGATFNKIDEIPVVKGWALGVMVIDGIYKCGFARPGVLPSSKLRERAIMHCNNYHASLVEGAFAFFEDWNCSEKQPCRDGTYHSPVSPSCTNTQMYRNYASDEPSPFNMFGTGNGGFSDIIENNKRTSVRYRVQIKPSSENGKAIVARSPKWGFMRSECVSPNNRRGGTRAN